MFINIYIYIYIHIVELITSKERFVNSWLEPIWFALSCADPRWFPERLSTFERSLARASSKMLASSKEHFRKCSLQANFRKSIFENAQRNRSSEESSFQNAPFKQSLRLGSVLDSQIHWTKTMVLQYFSKHTLGRLGSLLKRLKSILERLANVLERFWSILERLGSVLGASWAVLGASWSVSGASWSVLGASLSDLGASWSVLEGPGSVFGSVSE